LPSPYRPADLVLGLCLDPAGSGVALVRAGRLEAVAGMDGPGWPSQAVAKVLATSGLSVGAVAHVALALSGSGPARRLRRHLLGRQVRQHLGHEAAYVGAGRMGTRPLRSRDGRDRVTGHARGRCLAAAVAYTSGWRDGLVAVADHGRLQLWRATSGKLVALEDGLLDLADPVDAVARAAARLGLDRVALAGSALSEPALAADLAAVEGIQATWQLPLAGARAAAAGAALVAWADERQGAWVPAAPGPGVSFGEGSPAS